MAAKLSLAQYVKRRNGVPLGAKSSLSNMLYRSLGASSFKCFWQYWNPIWGYYLAYKIYTPLKQYFPSALATLITFIVSGALHDLAVTLIKQQWIFICTPWFFLMGLVLVTTQYFSFSYRQYSWFIRASINIALIIICLVIVIALQKL